MQDRVLDTPDILADRKPGFRFGAVEGLVFRLAGEADEVPAGIDEGVERIGFPRCRSAAARAVDMLPGRMPIERVAGFIELDVVGKHDGKLVARDRHRAALRAMDDRDRRAPIALAGDAPIAQAVLNGPAAPAGLLGPANDFR